MEIRKQEFWVGTLVIAAIGLLVLLAWALGGVSFLNHAGFELQYSFAGGVEVGSPVRVSGVKVGKVESIQFLPTGTNEKGATVSLKISVSPAALPSVREDSQFYINVAGIIGERYVEISPGSHEAKPLQPGAVIRGIDPPRIDQLLSQGYGVFGRVEEFLERNEKTLTEFLGSMNNLLTDANKMLKSQERKNFGKLLQNLTEVTENLNYFAKGLRGEKANRFVDQLGVLVDRAHEIDKATLKKFLQEEGVRARIF